MLNKIKKQIDRSLERFLDKIKIDYKLHLVDPILYESIREFSLRDGKRIRPILLALSYKGYRTDTAPMSPSIYYASTCIELLHNFMLIHDDIIDRSDLRRGKPTLHRLLEKAADIPEHKRLGCDLSIVAGDIVYALAIDAFLSINEDLKRKERALKYFIQTAVFTAMGEFADTLHGVRGLNRVSEKDVFLNYTLKTARYTFDCPLVVGAILAGADNKDIKALSKLGLLIGQAFQIQDDVIGIFDTEKNIGKSILSDLTESKKTILVCHAYRVLKGKAREKFLKIFLKNKKTYADLIAVRQIFVEAKSLSYSLEQINIRLDQALKILRNLKMAPKYKNLIEKCLFQLFKHSENLNQQYQQPNTAASAKK
jgi:geranylgeranyl diphosphate synthase type I